VKRLFRRLFSDIAGSVTINLDDGAGVLATGKNRSLYMNRFSETEIRGLMFRSGMSQVLSASGFPDQNYRIWKDDADIHRLEIYGGECKPDNLLIDLRLSEKRCALPGRAELLRLYFVEWLMTRNPQSTRFKPNRPQLPGQKTPGLGSLTQMINLMKLVSLQITEDGFINIPDHLHLAVMYSRQFYFINPQTEGVIRAVSRDLRRAGLYNIAWAAVTGAIRRRDTGEPLVYQPSEQVYPASELLRRYLGSRDYAPSRPRVIFCSL
jgi:hypothetical protein